MQEQSSFFALAQEPKEAISDGIHKRSLAAGAKIQIDEYFFDAGVSVSPHAHAGEEAGYVTAGEFEMQLATKSASWAPEIPGAFRVAYHTSSSACSRAPMS